ncbi:hypothetical protein LTR08_005091 [Meristemomyces frigidus]|nr:hypothetical protein LTR08_005091 [Meristemomyces frigidus]
MPESTRRMPQVAQVEDYNSDDSAARPHTRVQATTKTSSARSSQRRETTGGHNGTPAAAAPVQKAVASSSSSRQAAAASTSKSRPVIHTSNLQQSKQDFSARTTPVLRPGNPERRNTLPEQVQQEYEQKYAVWAAQYPEAAAQRKLEIQQQQAQVNAHAHAQAQAQAQAQTSYGQPIPAPNVARARAMSTSIASRPMSIHGYGIPSVSSSAHHGPPLSLSAYPNHQAYYPQYQLHPQQTYQQPMAYLGSTPPAQIMPAFPPQSPATYSPTSPNYAMMPPAPRSQPNYSARRGNPDISGLTQDLSRVTMSTHPTLSRTISARQPSASHMPGSYPQHDSYESESASTDSDSEYSEDQRAREREDREHRDREHQKRERQEREYQDREREERERRKRDGKMMPPPLRRPSIHTRQTAPVAELSHSSRPATHRTPHSDTSSEQFDSDRTARANVGRSRAESSFSSHSRQPSVSTRASSGGTKATSVSEGSGTRKTTIEDKHGNRRTVYLSQDQDKARYSERKKREELDMQERIEAYQQQVRGAQQHQLTAENVQKAARRTSGSHISRDSRKSGGSSKSSKPEGIKIQAGDNVLHVYGGASIEVHADEDGGQVFKIANGGGKDSAYYGSSRGSRLSRRKEPIDGYETAL